MSLEGLWTPYNLTYNTLMSIQNPGNEKFQEGVTRVLISFNAFLASVSSYLDIFPTNMRDHTGSTFTFKWENHLGRCIVWYVMKYERAFPTMENHLDPVGSILSCQQTLVKSNLDTFSWNFSGLGFYILTMGVKGRLYGLPCSSSVQVSRIRQPTAEVPSP